MTRGAHAAITVAVVLVLAGGACRTAAPEPEQAHEPEAADTHEDDPNVIHLSKDMLRDLRIGTATVAERRGDQDVTVLGEVGVDQNRYAEVAPPIAGHVTQVLVDTNADVKAGGPLAELRSTELGRARAALLSAQARHDLARQTLERKQRLAADRIAAQREVQEAEAAARAAESDASAAAAALGALGVADGERGDGSLFLVRAPIDGRILERRAVLGRYADPGEPLFVIADTSRVWIILQAFERDAVNIRPGTLAHVTLAARPGQEFDGRVSLVAERVDPGSRTIPVRVELPNPRGLMRPGMSASVRLEIGGGASTLLAVPAAALQRVGDRWLAFVPRNDHEYEMRPVGRGRDLGPDVEVVSGLRAGETIVVEGAFVLKAEAERRQGGDDHGH